LFFQKEFILLILKKIWKVTVCICVIPVSDSGEAEEALALRICFSLIRGFVHEALLMGVDFFEIIS